MIATAADCRPANSPPKFECFACFDWSGANTARPRGIALAIADANGGSYLDEHRWSREEVLNWLQDVARRGASMLIGLDLSPGFPFVDRNAFFPGLADSPPNAKALWRWVDEHSGASPHLSATGFLLDAEVARYFRHQRYTGDRFVCGRGRLRVCEQMAPAGLSPSSCFNLIGAAQVGKASLTGMRVLHRLGGRVPVWPFDPLPVAGPVIVEIYTSIAARAAGVRPGLSKLRDPAALGTALAALGNSPPARLTHYDDHSTDALITAAWLRTAAANPALWSPAGLTPEIAATEGWTFGVA